MPVEKTTERALHFGCSLLFFCLLPGLAQAATYTVTSSQCSGPGSIVAAIDQANLNTGTDTIEFASGLQVTTITTGGCELPPNTFPQDLFLGIVTDDVIINGNGAQLIGAPFWVDDSGSSNIVGACPSNPDVRGSILREAPGFLRVEPGVSVTVNDLTALDLSAYIRMESGSTVDLNNVEARRINDWYRDCARQAIEAPFGNATLTITDSYFEQIQNAQLTVGSPDGTVFRGSNVVSGAGSLTVTGTRFADALSAIQWSGDANIVTSQFQDIGWINAFDTGTMNIVNSAFTGTGIATGDSNSIRASNGAIVNIVASSMSLLFSECPAACASGFGAIVAVSNGVINLVESALGVSVPVDDGLILRKATGGNITADANTWIQPVFSQPAAALRAITGQASLLTAPPGLPEISGGGSSAALFFPQAITPLLGTVGDPGVLIDIIPDANPGEVNELVSPIDGTTITVDVFGSPRVDGNGTRTIGAVQLTLAPNAAVTSTTASQTDVFWSRPKDPSTTEPITGYGIIYEPTDGSTAPIRIDVSGATTLSTLLTGLLPNTEYRVTVVGVNVNGDGPPSNVVTFVTQRQPIAPPAPSNVPSLPISLLGLLTLLLGAAGARRLR